MVWEQKDGPLLQLIALSAKWDMKYDRCQATREGRQQSWCRGLLAGPFLISRPRPKAQ